MLSVSPKLGPTLHPHVSNIFIDFTFLPAGYFAFGNCLISLVSTCDTRMKYFAWERQSVKGGGGMFRHFQDDDEDEEKIRLQFVSRVILIFYLLFSLEYADG